MASPVKIKATVAEVVKHNASVASYRFAPQGRVPKFHAGQFLHIALDEYSPEAAWPESRVFSIASSPSTRHEELAVTISVKGRFTERILQTLEEGTECWLKLPYGEFLFPLDWHLTLIAGGVGITPYLSLLKQMLEDRKIIERAKGILMRRTGCSEPEAYRILQRSSQDRSKRMVDIAKAVLDAEPGATA